MRQTQGSSSVSSDEQLRRELLWFEDWLDNDAHRDRFTQLLWTQFHAAAFSFCEMVRLIDLLILRNSRADACQCLDFIYHNYVADDAPFPVPLSTEVRTRLLDMCTRRVPTDRALLDAAYYQVLATLLDLFWSLMGSAASDDESDNLSVELRV
eukprot:TRINITY_DN4685_c0_g1_i1.p4 TRINITY_DN4685_c0_g1~~TRINITY_DN4685_c0_g1_i1.p4  ORF type:complete len:153 (-),score=92.69 TRINITY_DN4685_c0_g1_i1:37-495(-)